MARPQSASDEQILQAARRVMTRRGDDAFTLSEVAEEVGVSRATIIARFQSAQALRVRLTAERVEYFAQKVRALPATRDGDSLIALAAFIGDMVGQKDKSNLTNFMRNFHANLSDEELLALERQRGDEFRNAVSLRMPDVAIPHDAAVRLFMSHIGGSLLEWESAPDLEYPRAHLIERTQQWLTLAKIPYSGRKISPDAPVRALSARPSSAGKRTRAARP